MVFHYQRAGTQYLLTAAHVSVDEYSAVSHNGEPGKLSIRQYHCFALEVLGRLVLTWQ